MLEENLKRFLISVRLGMLVTRFPYARTSLGKNKSATAHLAICHFTRRWQTPTVGLLRPAAGALSSNKTDMILF